MGLVVGLLLVGGTVGAGVGIGVGCGVVGCGVGCGVGSLVVGATVVGSDRAHTHARQCLGPV